MVVTQWQCPAPTPHGRGKLGKQKVLPVEPCIWKSQHLERGDLPGLHRKFHTSKTQPDRMRGRERGREEGRIRKVGKGGKEKKELKPQDWDRSRRGGGRQSYKDHTLPSSTSPRPEPGLYSVPFTEITTKLCFQKSSGLFCFFTTSNKIPFLLQWLQATINISPATCSSSCSFNPWARFNQKSQISNPLCYRGLFPVTI